MPSWSEIDIDELGKMLADDQSLSLLDVREDYEVEGGVIKGAVHIPLSELDERKDELDEGRWVVYCAAGVRSKAGAETIKNKGEVYSLKGGIEDWVAQGRPVVGGAKLNIDQRRRYSRHLLLPEIGPRGQKALLESSVLVIGAGGLGSPASLYLAAAGFGRIGLVDDDLVEMSNLQRQVIHTTSRVGMAKTSSAREALNELNPEVEVIEHQERLNADNVMELIESYDLIVNGADNFPTRYLLSDAAFRASKPIVDGSIVGFSGQVTVLAPHLDGPCYRCLYPQAPPPELAPSCSEAGVLGAMAGVIGSMQAVEAVKLITGAGDLLLGRLGVYDALDPSFLLLKISRDKDCPVCSLDRDRVPDYFPDYVAFCAA